MIRLNVDIPKHAMALSRIENNFEEECQERTLNQACIKTHHGNHDEAVFIARSTSLQADGEAQCTDDERQKNEANGHTLDERTSGVRLIASADGKIQPKGWVLNRGHGSERKRVSEKC